MKINLRALYFGSTMLVLGSVVAPAFAAEDVTCDISQVTTMDKLHLVLGKRAIEIVRRASSQDWKTDSQLPRIVAPDVTASLGGGDVGRPLGAGLDSVRKLSEMMEADAYSFLEWNNVPMQIDPCGTREVSVQFDDTKKQRRSTVKFVFVNGQLKSAAGWQGSFQSGQLRPHPTLK
ncbi:MAG: hypothetical protein K1X51_05180 [Rhodospirillaceae bacterium]|nr:hypothetical protein [Rhodospirillaceae bacterium]